MPIIGKIPYLDDKSICHSPEHNPPTSIYLEAGQYTWQCPACAKTKIFIVPLITMMAKER